MTRWARQRVYDEIVNSVAKIQPNIFVTIVHVYMYIYVNSNSEERYKYLFIMVFCVEVLI